MWKAAVKNYSYVFLSCHGDLLSCLNGEVRRISVVKSAKAQSEKMSCALKKLIAGLLMAETVIGILLLG